MDASPRKRFFVAEFVLSSYCFPAHPLQEPLKDRAEVWSLTIIWAESTLYHFSGKKQAAVGQSKQ